MYSYSDYTLQTPGTFVSPPPEGIYVDEPSAGDPRLQPQIRTEADRAFASAIAAGDVHPRNWDMMRWPAAGNPMRGGEWGGVAAWGPRMGPYSVPVQGRQVFPYTTYGAPAAPPGMLEGYAPGPGWGASPAPNPYISLAPQGTLNPALLPADPRYQAERAYSFPVPAPYPSDRPYAGMCPYPHYAVHTGLPIGPAAAGTAAAAAASAHADTAGGSASASWWLGIAPAHVMWLYLFIMVVVLALVLARPSGPQRVVVTTEEAKKGADSGGAEAGSR